MNGPPREQPSYRSYSAYLLERYGERTYRIGVDAGFSCPNRCPAEGEPAGSGGRSGGGCSFCDAYGARAPYLGDLSVLTDQIRSSAAFLSSRYGARSFLLYFQAFSGTYAEPDVLRRIYDAGLAAGEFRGLIVSTRPDCVDEEKAKLLASYANPRFEVWVELGLQSAHDRTLSRINRGHTVSDFSRAFWLLRGEGLKVAAHLVFGLPGEDRDDIIRTAEFLAALRPDGVKIHNLHIPKGTAIHDEFLAGELPVLPGSRHLEYVILALERLPPETVIMRLTCDPPTGRLAAPVRFPDKRTFLASLETEMRRRGTRQGRLFRG